MEEERPAEAAGTSPVFELEVCRVNVKIDSPLVAHTSVAVGVETVGVFYNAHPEETEATLESVFTHFNAKVMGFADGSIVKLSFHLKEDFLAFMDAFEATTVKQRLQEELSKIGFKGVLELTIVNDNLMEEERPAEAAGTSPVFELEACRVNVKIDSPLVAHTSVAVGVETVGVFYDAHPEETEATLRSLFTHFNAEVLGFADDSIVELSFHLKEDFLAFMDAFEATTVKQRLQEELSKIGFKGVLEVTIVNDQDVYDTWNRIR